MEILTAQSGADSRRYEQNWLLAVRPTMAEDMAAAKKAVSSTRFLQSAEAPRNAATSASRALTSIPNSGAAVMNVAK